MVDTNPLIQNSSLWLDYHSPAERMQSRYFAPVLGAEHTVVLIHVNEIDSLSQRLADCVNSQARLTVLIEDDEGAARAAKLALRKNFSVEVHHNGQQDLEAWVAEKHDIVLLNRCDAS